ncbi:MAG TPA: hypothetical protein VFM98_06585 [Ramlibacter sp.]|uniref:hypothetical protein n=1 Tax=Ramlibacter sp. TaxID=1917967 RepID=UPI002D80B84D|nr:hypothetical protein [Ramlibacter sp.]HET8745251.1 hypothetical protein [Ramlibacter sp.]
MNKRLIFWTTFLGGAGALVAYDYLQPAPAPEGVAVAARPAHATHGTAPNAARPASAPVAVAPIESASAPLASLRSTAAERVDAGAAADVQAASPAAPAASGPELFAVRSWQPPPPPPPPPAAPPLPFSFLGRLDDGKPKVFLQRGERLYAVAVGDVIDGQYRLERIEANQLLLTYLPMNVKQTITIGKS